MWVRGVGLDERWGWKRCHRREAPRLRDVRAWCPSAHMATARAPAPGMANVLRLGSTRPYLPARGGSAPPRPAVAVAAWPLAHFDADDLDADVVVAGVAPSCSNADNASDRNLVVPP
jgi:hypothetical protein